MLEGLVVPAFAFSSHPRVLMVVEHLSLRAASALLYFEVAEAEPLVDKTPHKTMKHGKQWEGLQFNSCCFWLWCSVVGAAVKGEL